MRGKQILDMKVLNFKGEEITKWPHNAAHDIGGMDEEVFVGGKVVPIGEKLIFLFPTQLEEEVDGEVVSIFGITELDVTDQYEIIKEDSDG